jgi:hypothetical protein
MWSAKQNLLQTEYNFKVQQLQNEATNEKNRIAESISDTTQRANTLNNIDTELKAKMSSAEMKFQTEKTKLNDEQNAARKKNNEEFFDALKKAGEGDLKATLEFLKKKADEDKLKNKGRTEDKVKLKEAFAGLMKGDSELFQKYMTQKIQTDKDGNATQLQAFAEKTGRVADIATQAIGFLKDLNTKYLEFQIAGIKKEEQEQLDSWKREYDSGKISKEEFEKGNVRITEESKKKELAARKDAFEREKKMNIAAAFINTAQAALKSFAMFGWPIGLIMAALAAVAGGIQIAAISRQQFQGRDGGVFKNAGVAQGGLHGSSYGQGGISMFDRASGREVGEIEGGEPVMVLSRNTYGNNKAVIDRLLHSSLHKNGAPITMKDGGVFRLSPKMSYGDGGIVDGGMNVDGMMDENKKSQETMEKTRDNTQKTAENVGVLSRIMEKFQQSGGNQNMQIARVFESIMNRQLNVLNQIQVNQRNDRAHLENVVYNMTWRMQNTENQQATRSRNMFDAFMKHSDKVEANRKSESDKFYAAFVSEMEDMQYFQRNQANAMMSFANRALNTLKQTANSNQLQTIQQMQTELNEMRYQTMLLNDIKWKPDGSNNILHAIGSLSANLSKAKM